MVEESDPRDPFHEALESIGWHRGRRVDTSEWRREFSEADCFMHDAADEFLTEFGGLRSEFSSPGVTSAREPFEFDPSLCLGEEDRFVDWNRRTGKNIFPLGELDNGRFFLGIDEDSVMYLVADWLGEFGPGLDGLRKLILGYAPHALDE